MKLVCSGTWRTRRRRRSTPSITQTNTNKQLKEGKPMAKVQFTWLGCKISATEMCLCFYVTIAELKRGGGAQNLSGCLACQSNWLRPLVHFWLVTNCWRGPALLWLTDNHHYNIPVDTSTPERHEYESQKKMYTRKNLNWNNNNNKLVFTVDITIVFVILFNFI